jgi:hypothetical protein
MPEERFREAQTLPGMQKIHCVIPASKKPISGNSVFRSKCVQHHTYRSLQEEEYQAKDTGTFLTFKYDTKWWPVYVLQVKDSEIQIIVSHSSGPSKSYMYPSPPGIFSFRSAYKSGSRNNNGLHAVSEKKSCYTEKLETTFSTL